LWASDLKCRERRSKNSCRAQLKRKKLLRSVHSLNPQRSVRHSSSTPSRLASSRGRQEWNGHSSGRKGRSESAPAPVHTGLNSHSPTQPHSLRPQRQAKATSSSGPAPAVLQEDINGPWTVSGGRHQRWPPRLGASKITGIRPPLFYSCRSSTSKKP